MAGIKFDHVWKRFGEVSVLKDLNIDIPDQEFLVLVGPSGCGKSTALRCLAGLEEITDGNIYIGDRVVNDVPPKDRDIAMVFQSYALYPHMSVYDNMAFGLKLRKTPKTEIDKRVKEAAELLSIGHLLDRKPKALSGGQRQRVALGRAIVRNPAVFLMDEPLSNLDAKLRVQTRGEISKLHQRLKTTFIYVTHDQVEAMTMGSRIAVMKDGILQQLDTPQTLYDHPANMFVAGFIGSPSMNFFEGKLDRGTGGLVIDFGPFHLPIPADKTDAVSSNVGKPVYFGIRPEDVHDAHYVPRGVDENAKLAANVTVVEPLGSEVFAYVENGGKEMVSRLDPRTSARVGQKLDLVIDMSKMHVFDRESEKALA
ncbi:MAG TPA: ABC transporter ATP-binding protein [Kouleothrix sp.]|uniref:ABC transporter ATP-binding protein n=1 Tax=Kouleothrix sp. TaxID=2779161 RepID=UPI002B6584AB|nr:ABC transporter ATP-binding protein [Kouleothrix sp.]HRC75971.1 ABC transporter ATP-binding protein [Kouleothrix sp.]